jgi:hypothetical protein
MRNVLKIVCGIACLGGLLLGQSAQAQIGVATPVQYQAKLIQIGDVPAIQGGIVYDNTTDSGFYFPPPAGSVPVTVADDVRHTGT